MENVPMDADDLWLDVLTPLGFVRDGKLHRRGIGWIDAHLLASALVGRLRLWTTDPPLAMLAKELGITYE